MVVANNIVVNNTQWGIIEEYGTIGTGIVISTTWSLTTGAGRWRRRLRNRCSSGTIIVDPQFVNYTGGADGSYALKSTSPGRDHGTSTEPPPIMLMAAPDLSTWPGPWRIRVWHQFLKDMALVSQLNLYYSDDLANLR